MKNKPNFIFFRIPVFLCLLLLAHMANAGGSYLDEAISAYENFEFERALDLLSKATKDSRASDKSFMASVHLYRGLVRFTLGQRKQAQKEFTEALHLDHSIYPPDDTSPKILSVFNKIKSALERREHKPVVSSEKPAFDEVQTGGKMPLVVKNSKGRLWTWVMTGVGSAALVTAGVFAGLAAKSKTEFDDTKWASDAVEKRDEVEQRSLTANILFGVGGAAMVGALILFFVEDGQSRQAADKSAFRLQVGLSGAFATVRF